MGFAVKKRPEMVVQMLDAVTLVLMLVGIPLLARIILFAGAR
jgi:hypothetical protein